MREGLRLQLTPEPCIMVIFGATGDLTMRKLVPALYNMALQGLLPTGFASTLLAPPQGEKRQLDLVARLRLKSDAPPPHRR